MSGSTSHGTCWSPPSRGARGESETCKPPSISTSIPGARPSEPYPRFAANHLIPSPVTFSCAANPAPAPSSDNGIRAHIRLPSFPVGLCSRTNRLCAIVTIPGNRLCAIATISTKEGSRPHRIRQSPRPAIAPFRLASLSYRKQHALTTPTALTKKRGVDWPNGTPNSQGNVGEKHEPVNGELRTFCGIPSVSTMFLCRSPFVSVPPIPVSFVQFHRYFHASLYA